MHAPTAMLANPPAPPNDGLFWAISMAVPRRAPVTRNVPPIANFCRALRLRLSTENHAARKARPLRVIILPAGEMAAPRQHLDKAHQHSRNFAPAEPSRIAIVVFTRQIGPTNGVIAAVGEPILAATRRVLADKPPAKRLVVSGPHVDQAGFIILLMSQVGAVSLHRRAGGGALADGAPGVKAALVAQREASAPGSCQRRDHVPMRIIQRKHHGQ